MTCATSEIDGGTQGSSASEEVVGRAQGEAQPAVWTAGITVRFGEMTAVDGVSLEVPRATVFGLLGPNGAGKTTTMRVLTTLLRASEGEARVNGFDVRSASLQVRASIGYVPQALSADGALTARENLEFYARATGVPRRERRDRILAAVQAMHLESMLDRLARTLSGGMLRRLEVGTALLNRPAVLFLDEPTVGLDPGARALVWDRLHALREDAGTTLFVTTHMMEEAERHCDDVAIIDGGRLIEQGAPSELLRRNQAGTLEDVFTAVTGRGAEGGKLADVRTQRRLARRLG